MVRAAELQDLDRPASNLAVEHIAQDHDVVGDELLDAESRDVPVIIRTLGGEDRRHLHPLERRRDPEQLAAHDRLIRELREYRAERIHRHALRSDLLDGVLHPREQRAEVEAAALDRLDTGIRRRIDERQATRSLPLLEIPPEAAHVRPNVFGGLLERDEHAVLTRLDSSREELHRKYRLSTPRRPGDQGSAMHGKPPFRDDVEARDAGGKLLYGRVLKAHRHVVTLWVCCCRSEPRVQAALCPCPRDRRSLDAGAAAAA